LTYYFEIVLRDNFTAVLLLQMSCLTVLVINNGHAFSVVIVFALTIAYPGIAVNI